MRIDPNKVIEDRLAASFGLEQYGYIISQWKTVDVSADEDFQTKFNGYYRVRRNAEWRECYYAFFSVGSLRSYIDGRDVNFNMDDKRVPITYANGRINSKDVIRILRYIAGWDVILY